MAYHSTQKKRRWLAYHIPGDYRHLSLRVETSVTNKSRITIMQIAPSKNPEKESKQFATIGLVCSIVGLFVWFAGIAGLAFSVRGLLLSRRVKASKYFNMSIAGVALGLVDVLYFAIR